MNVYVYAHILLFLYLKLLFLGGKWVPFISFYYILSDDIIPLMHSFEVNIRICQPQKSDVHCGESEINIIFEG